MAFLKSVDFFEIPDLSLGAWGFEALLRLEPPHLPVLLPLEGRQGAGVTLEKPYFPLQ